MMAKKISAMFSQEPEVGVKCMVIRGFFDSQAWPAGVLVRGVVVADHVQFDPRIGAGHLFQEPEEFIGAGSRRR